ncbi:hypothetical protein FS749_014416 [Ceratobasidium sp. UAMH 11750]|nr:hypothetical protein FS749_014416 [Ceratobasidium sp. UAMH 11750]
MSSLVKSITTLDIVRLTCPESSSIHDEPPPMIKSPLHFFTTLFAGCPKLTTLRLEFDREANYEMMMDENTLRLISRHPLRELSIQTIFTAFDVGGLTVERVVAYFPRLEVFRWPELYTTYEELHHFVRMPRLRYLAVQGELRHIDPGVMGRLPWLHNVPPNTELRTLESTFSYFNPGSWFRASTYISHLWPNVQLATREFHPMRTMTLYCNAQQLDIANAYIRLLRRRGRGGRRDKMRMWTSVGGELVDWGLDF